MLFCFHGFNVITLQPNLVPLITTRQRRVKTIFDQLILLQFYSLVCCVEGSVDIFCVSVCYLSSKVKVEIALFKGILAPYAVHGQDTFNKVVTIMFGAGFHA